MIKTDSSWNLPQSFVYVYVHRESYSIPYVETVASSVFLNNTFLMSTVVNTIDLRKLRFRKNLVRCKNKLKSY